MQKDLDVYLVSYNTRTHQGRGMKGRTPYQVFKERLPRNAKKSSQQQPGKEVKKAV